MQPNFASVVISYQRIIDLFCQIFCCYRKMRPQTLSNSFTKIFNATRLEVWYIDCYVR